MILTEIAEQFRTELTLLGYTLTDPIVIDGKIHRFSTKPDNPNDTAGWYVLHKNLDYVAGAWGDNRSGAKEKWRSGKGKHLTPKERRALAFQIKEEQAEQQAITLGLYEQASRYSVRAWKQGHTDFDHQYLRDKNIQPYGIRQNGGRLIIPIGRADGMTSTQFIEEDGSKKFRTHGMIKGCYHVISASSDRIYICEGFATGATLHEHTEAAVIVAFNAGNLPLVAVAIRKQYPDALIIIAADNDQWTDGNPGLKAGRKAAALANAKLIWPDFTGLDTSSHPTDFNDLIALGGAIQ